MPRKTFRRSRRHHGRHHRRSSYNGFGLNRAVHDSFGLVKNGVGFALNTAERLPGAVVKGMRFHTGRSRRRRHNTRRR